jgi:hypothetical protein
MTDGRTTAVQVKWAPLPLLMAGMIDYAGLFPPAALDMRTTVANYASYLSGAHCWALGRLIVPAARLEEFKSAVLGMLPADDTAPWRLSVLVEPDSKGDFDRIRMFNRIESGAVIEAVEMPARSPDRVRAASAATPVREMYFELPIDSDIELLEAVSEVGAAAKIRTGGTTPDRVPSAGQVASFLNKCHSAGAAFKATAGLHHPLRSVAPLTYEAEAPRAPQHGFLNLLVAAALVVSGNAADEDVVAVLEERTTRAFRFEDGAVAYGRHRLGAETLRSTRSFLRSFGSCSFEEPIDDLWAMGLL